MGSQREKFKEQHRQQNEDRVARSATYDRTRIERKLDRIIELLEDLTE